MNETGAIAVTEIRSDRGERQQAESNQATCEGPGIQEENADETGLSHQPGVIGLWGTFFSRGGLRLPVSAGLLGRSHHKLDDSGATDGDLEFDLLDIRGGGL